MTKTEQTNRRLAEIDAVQGNARVGLTIGDVDDILAIVRSGVYPVVRTADVIGQTWRATDDYRSQSETIERAANIVTAVRHFDETGVVRKF